MRHTEKGETVNRGFKPKIKALLTSCGIDPQEINPTLLGKGAHHNVYRTYNGNTVVKIPTRNHIGIINTTEQEAENIGLYKRYFEEFSLPTTLIESPLGYCVLMDYVQGKPLSVNDVFTKPQNRRGRKHLTPIGEELMRLFQANNTLEQETGKTIDLVGLDGVLDAIGGAKLGRNPQRLGNVLIVNGHLKIIDYDLMTINVDKNFDRIKAHLIRRINNSVIDRKFKPKT